MASCKQRPDGQWRAQVQVGTRRASKILRTKREAMAWAAATETELRAEKAAPPGANKTLGDVLRRYRDEVSPTHRAERWERYRIEAMLRADESMLPVDALLSTLTPDSFVPWRDVRKRKVKPGSLLRDLGILTAALESARREWRWCAENPIKDMRRPESPAHRERVIHWREVRAMLRALGYRQTHPARSITESAGFAFMLALHTGMRAGELCGLRWEDVHPHHCRLPVTKTTPRDVPLEPRARRLIERMRGFDPVMVFGLSRHTLDALFRRARDRAGLSGFTFHDARHTAATRLASRKLNVLDLCKMFGWSNPKRAMTYYNPTAAQIAARLAARPLP